MKRATVEQWALRAPIASTVLLEYANVAQLWRMWHVHSALGQSPMAWISVNAALWLWLGFYAYCVPGGLRSWAARSTMVGLVINSAVIFTSVYLQ